MAVSANALSGQQTQRALKTYVTKLTADDRARLVLLTRQLRELADVLATVPLSENGRQKPIEDEVLRRMEHPDVSAQRALISRATDPAYSRSDEMVERIISNPDIVKGVAGDIEDMRTASDIKRFGLFIRYANVQSIPLSAEEITRALDQSDKNLQRAALFVLVKATEDIPRQLVPKLKMLVASSTDSDVLPLAVELLARISADEAASQLAPRANKDEFWRSDLGTGAFAALTRTRDGVDAAGAGKIRIAGEDIYSYGDCRVLPGSLALVTRQTDGKSIVESLVTALAAVLRRDKANNCDSTMIANALDAGLHRITEMGLTEGDFSSAFYDFIEQPSTVTPTLDSVEIKALVEILSKAHATRSALLSDQNRLRALILNPKVSLHPVLAALIMSLPIDHPFLSLLRQFLQPGQGGSLVDYVRDRHELLTRVLAITVRDRGWTSDQLDGVLAISNASESADVNAAAFDVIFRAGGAQRLLEYFDNQTEPNAGSKPAITRIRALRAFLAAVRQMPDTSAAYTPLRLAWLWQQLTDEGLRGPVVRALGQRPANMSPDDTSISTALSTAATQRNGKGAVGACLDAATLGPYSRLDTGLTILEVSESLNYEGEPWPSVCEYLLASSEGGMLSDTGQALVSFVSRPAAIEASRLDVLLRLSALAKVWNQASERALSQFDQRPIAEAVASLSALVGWGLDDFSRLREWDARLRPIFPDQASAIRTEWLKRGALLAAMAIPGGLVVHIAFWLLLLTAYPRSVRLQTHVFYNPWVRKIFGLGYVDLLLVWIAPIRRRFFEPFRTPLSGELERIGPGTAFGAYFPKSEIVAITRIDLEREIRTAERAALTGTLPANSGAIVQALAHWHGPTWLFGPSGRGKTSYLRHALTTNARIRFPFIYLRAAECGDDLLDTICSRLGGLGRDKDLVTSLVHAGLFDVYVDGLNEVDRERQEVIARFIVDHRSANIFVASQEVGISLPSKLSTYYLLPLTRAQMKEFLASRAESLDIQAPIRGNVFIEKSAQFIDGLVEEAALIDTDRPDNPDTNRRRELAASFIATLANPIDLETAASLLSLDIEPDPFRLQEQQFDLVRQDYESRLARPFPTMELSKSVLSARQANSPELDAIVFGTAVAILEERKQVRRISVASVGGFLAEYHFRHDKIRDFYTHFAFLHDVDARFSLARDDRFSGVYDYLARELPPAAVADLREYLLSAAVDSNDHRLSDRFLQHLRWRALLDEVDPPWLSNYETPTADKALTEFEQLSGRRQQIEIEMHRLRTTVDAERLPARLLSARTVETLEGGVLRLFERSGAKIRPTPGGAAPIVEPPWYPSFSLFCLAGNNVCTAVAAIGMRSRLLQSHGWKILIINPTPDYEPKLRDWGRVSEWARSLAVEGLLALGTIELYELATHSIINQESESFWHKLRELDVSGTTAQISPR
ncbi:hypothetical protein ASG19_17800 [Rhizobium sp. Leaf306]|nr:hypothetical protein ASG19_17800 [Rhizobium sp. Leaf306]